MYRTETLTDAKNRHQWLICTADHMGDLFHEIARQEPFLRASADLETCGEGDHWAESRNVAHAIEIGERGWAKGRERLIKVLDESNVIRRQLPHRIEALEVAGAYPIVPVAISGDPACMVTVGDQMTRTKPVVKLIVNVAASGAVSAETIMCRGGAILSWVDGLEDLGYRVEIDIIETGLFKHKKKSVLFIIKAKHADEPVEIDRLSFLLCHPSVQRRLFFAMYEREKAQDKFGLTNSESVSYGWPTDDIPNDYLGMHSIYMPALLRNNPDYATPALAVCSVERAIMASLQIDEMQEFGDFGN